jgi:hypothetical protein
MKKITFNDLANYTAKGKDKSGSSIKLITIPMYDVNKSSGEVKVYKPNTIEYFKKPHGGHYFCQIGCIWINGKEYRVKFGEESNTAIRGFVASNHILFLNKEEAKVFSMSIFKAKINKFEEKLELVKAL